MDGLSLFLASSLRGQRHMLNMICFQTVVSDHMSVWHNASLFRIISFFYSAQWHVFRFVSSLFLIKSRVSEKIVWARTNKFFWWITLTFKKRELKLGKRKFSTQILKSWINPPQAGAINMADCDCAAGCAPYVSGEVKLLYESESLLDGR